MFTAQANSEILNLFHALDAQDGFERKLQVLSQWARVLPGVEEICYLSFAPGTPDITAEDRRFSDDTPVIITAGSPSPPWFRQRSDWQAGSLFYPLPHRHGQAAGALVFRTAQPLRLLTEIPAELGLLASKIGDLQTIAAAAQAAVPAHSPEPLTEQQLWDAEHRQVLETLNLPLYLCHLDGSFVFVNKPFLTQFGFDSLANLNQAGTDFFDPVERAEQIKLLARNGFSNGFHLGVSHRGGRRMAVRDYATLRGGYVLGVLFDVTEYVNLNREMKEALEIQELLNDKIINSALILQKTQTTSIRALARLAEYRDQETGGHLQRICDYTAVLVKEIYRRQPYDFRISDQYVEDIILSSMLHDIGKVAVPDSILRKKNNLTDEEWEVMKKHTIWGWQLLNQADKELGEQSFLTLASQIALSHHEKWDGTGYPHGLKGDKIPLSARIEAIADVYDALTSVRPYKHAWTHEEAIDEIVSLKGVHFDPQLVDLLLDVQDQFVKIKANYVGETS